MKRALITGISGQDGIYLAEFLARKGYEVHGTNRRPSLINTDRLAHPQVNSDSPSRPVFTHHGDMTDANNLIRVIQEVQPDEIYNLAAQSGVAVSFESPECTANVDAIGTLRLLEAIRILGLMNEVRFYQASTSELYGLIQQVPQTENTPFYPRSPHAVAKLYAYWITVNYREAYGMYACNGILFNNLYDTPVVNLNADEMRSLTLIAGQLRDEMEKRQAPDQDVLLSYLKIFLINATRTKVEQSREGAADTRKLPMTIENLRTAIEANFRTLRSPGDYSRLLHISSKALNKASKSHFNKTLTSLIAERLIIEAKRELYLTSKPVKQIAFELGYIDEFYFSRFFKKNVGVSPQTFRDKVGFDKLTA